MKRREARGGVRLGQEERQGCGKVRCRQGLPGVVGAEEAGKRPACRIKKCSPARTTGTMKKTGWSTRRRVTKKDAVLCN